MPEILSQEEIDALLSSVTVREEAPGEEEVPARKRKERKPIRVYNFSSPDKFSKDQIRTLHMLHEGFNRLITSSLSTYLRTPIQSNLVEVIEQSYEDFIKKLSSPTIIGIFNMSPLDGSAAIEITPRIVYLMFDRLLGGKGAITTEEKELTDIEQSVVEGIMVRILTSLKDAWANIVSLKPYLEKLETNPAFCQIVSPNDKVASISFEIKIGEVVGNMNLCLPYVVLEPIISKLSAQIWFSSSKASTPEIARNLRKRLEKTIVPFVVEVGNVILTLREVLNLQKGDVIRLNKSVNDLFEGKISDKTKFYVMPGRRGSRLAVQVIKKVIEGDKE